MTIKTVTFDKPKAILVCGTSTAPTLVSYLGVVPAKANTIVIVKVTKETLYRKKWWFFKESYVAELEEWDIKPVNPTKTFIYQVNRTTQKVDIYIEGYTIEEGK